MEEHQEEHAACRKLNAGMVVCLEHGANDLHMVKLMPRIPLSLDSLKSR